MTTARLRLEGIRASGIHGVNPEERERAQEFVIGLEVVVDATSDALQDTADYRGISECAREVVEGNSYGLLETLADAVARAVFDLGAVKEVTARVHKLGAAASLGIDDVSAEVTIR
ncbi:MAG: dihydroneopterin aldolase [Actinomycetota bacterium]